MKQKKVSRKKINEFFRELTPRSQQPGAYSTKAIIQDMGFDYDQVAQWADTNQNWHNVLQASRLMCSSNAEIDSLKSKLTVDVMLGYLFEGDDEFIALYPTKEAQEELIQSAIRDEQHNKAKQ